MKKIIALVLLFSATINSFGMEYLKNFFQIKVTRLNYPIKPRVEVIELVDPINFKESLISLLMAAKNNEVSGILLMVKSTGGHTAAFSVVHDVIKKIAKIKPVVALIMSSALSGGYMLASPAHYIIAHSCSDVGSIGVFAEREKHTDLKITDRAVEAKMEVELFSVGEFKTVYHPYGKLSDKDRKYIQENLEKVYQQFVSMVGQDRNLNCKDYKTWAEGKAFLAYEALELGLIDEIGTIFEAEAKILELIRQRNPDCVFDNEITTNLFPPLR